MFPNFNLTSSIGGAYSSAPEDVYKTKSALNTLGYLTKSPFDDEDGKPASPVDSVASTDMFEATKAFQKDHKLKVDGVIKPGGETAAALDKKLAPKPSPLAGPKPPAAKPLGPAKPKLPPILPGTKRTVVPKTPQPQPANTRLAQAAPHPTPAPAPPLPLPGSVFDPTSQTNKDFVKGMEKATEAAREWLKTAPTLPGPARLPNPFYRGPAQRTDQADPSPGHEGAPIPEERPPAGTALPPADPPPPPKGLEPDLPRIPPEGRPDQSGEFNKPEVYEVGRDLKQARDFRKKHNLDRSKLHSALGALKRRLGLKGKEVDIDWESGDVYDKESGEHLGNVLDEAK